VRLPAQRQSFRVGLSPSQSPNGSSQPLPTARPICPPPRFQT